MNESRFSRALKKAFKFYIIIQIIITVSGLLFALISNSQVTVSIISLPLFLIVLLITYLAESE